MVRPDSHVRVTTAGARAYLKQMDQGGPGSEEWGKGMEMYGTTMAD